MAAMALSQLLSEDVAAMRTLLPGTGIHMCIARLHSLDVESTSAWLNQLLRLRGVSCHGCVL